jgi:acyl-CoA hydrolase
VAVYHPPRGRWYIQQSGNGQLRIQNWGARVARPVQAYAQGALEDIRVHSHGDSITYGMGSYLNGPPTGYPVLLEEYLEGGFGGDFVSLNYGVPGETTDGGVNRLPWDLAYSDADVLLIMEGTNDHFFNHPYDQIESNLRTMVVQGLARGKFVVIATIPPVIPAQRYNQQQRIIGFNPRIYAIARDYNIPVAPVYEFITSMAGWEYLLMDPSTGNHPNDTGYAFVRAAFYTALQPYLETADIN